MPEVRLIDANALKPEMEILNAADMYLVCHIIDNAPTIEAEPVRWILTKDRLPDKPGRYLAYAERTIYCNHNEIDDEEYRTNVLYFDGKEWTDIESICYDVIRWMHIPKYRTS